MLLLVLVDYAVMPFLVVKPEEEEGETAERESK